MAEEVEDMEGAGEVVGEGGVALQTSEVEVGHQEEAVVFVEVPHEGEAGECL